MSFLEGALGTLAGAVFQVPLECVAKKMQIGMPTWSAVVSTLGKGVRS